MTTHKWTLPTVVIIILAVVVFVGYTRLPQPTPAPQTSTCPTRTIQENVDRADIIMTGSVDIVLPGEPYVSVMVIPGKIYKGQADGLVKIWAHEANASNTAGHGNQEIHFASDQEPYLLFLRQGDGGYLTSRCDGSRLLGSGLTDDERRVLESTS